MNDLSTIGGKGISVLAQISTSFSAGANIITFYYISDMHLNQHLPSAGSFSQNRMLKKIVKNIFANNPPPAEKDFVLFLGDIADSIELVRQFFPFSKKHTHIFSK